MNCNYFMGLNLCKNSSGRTKLYVKSGEILSQPYGLLSSKNQIFLVSQQGTSLDLQQGGESELPQTQVAFNTPFFHESILKS